MLISRNWLASSCQKLVTWPSNCTSKNEKSFVLKIFHAKIFERISTLTLFRIGFEVYGSFISCFDWKIWSEQPPGHVGLAWVGWREGGGGRARVGLLKPLSSVAPVSSASGHSGAMPCQARLGRQANKTWASQAGPEPGQRSCGRRGRDVERRGGMINANATWMKSAVAATVTVGGEQSW